MRTTDVVCTGMGDASGMTIFFNHLIACVLAMALFLPAFGAAAEAGAPAASPGTSSIGTASFETQPFAFPADQRRTERPQPVRGNAFTISSLFPVFLSIAAICGLLIGGLCLAKKYLPGSRQIFSHPAMEVLGRTHLDPRRYVSLVRVGKRILVLGVTQDEINPLSEITDDGEITSIMEVARPKTEMGLTIFQRLFQKQILENEAGETAAMARIEADRIGEQMSSLRERVRAIRESEEPARRVDAIG